MELRALAEQVLFGVRLEDKLPAEGPLTDLDPGPPLLHRPDFPGRPDALRPRRGERAPFPSRVALAEASARGHALHFFANHELLAMELMALMLLRFPDAPPAFRQGLAQTLREEQRHLGAYRAHMARLGVAFGEVPVNAFFWDCLADSADPAAFLAGMSLTFEQANLDWCRRYGAWMAEAGDLEAAALLEEVRRDEVGHVRHGLSWLRRWSPGEDDWGAWTRRLRPPLTPERAKGAELCVASREEVGLDPGFIRALRAYSHSKGRPPVVRLFNPGLEAELGPWRGERAAPPAAAAQALERDLGLLPALFGGREDVVALPRRPSDRFLGALVQAGFPLPELIEAQRPEALAQALQGRALGGLEPWGWSPRAAAWLLPLRPQVLGPPPLPTPGWVGLSDKLAAAQDLEALLRRLADPRLDPPEDAGRPLPTLEALAPALALAQARGHRGVLLKAPLSAAGRGALRLEGPPTAAQARWILRELARGPLLVEPWLQRVLDLSVQLWVEDSRVRPLGLHRFFTDESGRYEGSWLGAWTVGLPPELAAFVTGQGRDGGWVERALAQAAAQVGARAQALGYRGPMGIDALVHRAAGGLRLRPLVEANARSTMGRVALALRRHLAPGRVGLWRVLHVSEVQRAGHAHLEAWLATRPPAELDPRGGLRAGVLALSEALPGSTFAGVMVAGLDEAGCRAQLGC